MSRKRRPPALIGVPDEQMIPGGLTFIIASLGGLSLPDQLWRFYYSVLTAIGILFGFWLVVITVERWRYYRDHPESERPSLLRGALSLLIGALLLGTAFWIIYGALATSWNIKR